MGNAIELKLGFVLVSILILTEAYSIQVLFMNILYMERGKFPNALGFKFRRY